MKILYFTATGNSLAVARGIAATCSVQGPVELLSIPQMLRSHTDRFSDDAFGFVFPCFAGGTPRIVDDFVRTSSFSADYLFAVQTCGADLLGLDSIEQAGAAAGIAFSYLEPIVMVDNFLPYYDIAEEVAAASAKHIDENIARIAGDIAARRHHLFTMEEGAHRFMLDFRAKNFADLLDTSDEVFIVTGDCTGCGTCTHVCPVGNVSLSDDGTPRFAHRCESCGACLQLCPTSAIHYPREKGSTHFLNPAVTVADIIAANDRLG